MDLTFFSPEGIFNYRVCGIILRNGKLLVMRDEGADCFYLPGGRVRLHERAEDALRRELREELDIDAELVRPLWLNQVYFTDRGSRYHELCLYFLTDVSKTDLMARGDVFIRRDEGVTHTFSWVDFSALADMPVYPVFIRQQIFHLPDHLELRTEEET